MLRILIISCVLLLVACNQAKNPEFNGQSTAKAGKVLPSNIKSIFQAKCTPCHTSSGGTLPNWLDYKTVVAKKDLIKARAIDIADPSRPMPPTGSTPLSAEEKKTILEWIAAGTPGEAGAAEPTAPQPEPPTPPTPPSANGESLPVAVKKIIESKCTPCHTSSAMGLPNWLDYKTAFAKKDLIKARAVDIVDPAKPMPPAGMAPLSADEKKVIGDWINAGAPSENTGSGTNPNPPNPNDPPQIPADTPLTYNDLVYPFIIKNRCDACHNANADQSVMPNWGVYKNVLDRKDKIVDRIFVKRDMPPVGMPMSNSEREMIKKWIDAGAPEKVLPPQPPTPTSKVNYQEHIKPRVFEIYCKACHNADMEKTNSKLKDWLNYQKAKDNKDLIYQRVFVEKDAAKRMPLGATLPDTEAQQLKDWIAAGAPEW